MLNALITGATEPLSVATAHNLTRFIGDNTGLSYHVASFVMDIVDWILGFFGLEHNDTLVTFLYASVVFGIALIVGWIVQWIVLKIVELIARRTSATIYKALTGQRFFHKFCRIVPPLVFLALIEFTLSNHDTLSATLIKFTLIYIVVVMTVSLCAIIMAVWQSFNENANKRKLPLSGIAQLAKAIVWIIAVIIIVSILVDKSPVKLLTGLGACSAILMLVFKDNILSLVAGIQLSSNDSLHVGDWIVVDGTNANGTVLDVSLVSIKIQNWDKTTTSLPPYHLISSGFTNYRSMQQSNTRRICRSIMIDADSVLPATPEMLDKISKLPFMAEFIEKKLAQKAAGQVADVDNPAGLVNGTIDTNLGLFRAYVKMWLDANQHVAHDSDCFVSTLAQTAAGIPFQVYCFTATSKWFPYEAIQDTIFEHIAIMLQEFGLYTFENPSGRDTIVDGYISGGKSIDPVYGVPQPFFKETATPATQPAAAPSQPAGK